MNAKTAIIAGTTEHELTSSSGPVLNLAPSSLAIRIDSRMRVLLPSKSRGTEGSYSIISESAECLTNREGGCGRNESEDKGKKNYRSNSDGYEGHCGSKQPEEKGHE